MFLRVADDHHAPAIGSYHIALRNGLLRVVCALGVNVRADGTEQRLDGRLCEDRDEIYGAQAGDYFGALAFGDERASLPFLSTHLGVRVDRDDQQIAQGASAFQVAYVPDVQEVEAAVGKNDPRTLPARNGDPRDQPVAVENT